MKIYKCFVTSAVLLLAISHFAIAQDGAKKKMANDVQLYGQEFTPSEHAALQSALPSMFGGAEQDIKTVLEGLGSAVDAQRSAYEGGLTDLAQSLDQGGYLAAMFMRPDADGYLAIDPEDSTYKEMLEGPEANREAYINGEVNSWLEDGSWKDKVDTYNSVKLDGMPELDGAGIAALAQKHDSYEAVRKLDLAVRQSPEVQNAGLSDHGVVEPKPVEVDPNAADTATPSWMGNADDGVSVKP